MTRKLLTDTYSIKLLHTESTDNGKIRCRGEFARAGVATANGRIYPESVWRSQISKLKKDIEARKVFMEADHPADGKTKLQRVCGVLTSLEIDDNGVIIGEAEIFPETTNGKNLAALLKNNCEIGVSSRGYGSVQTESGYDIVQDDFVLMTFDFVADPANATSYPNFKIEGKEKQMEQKDKKQIISEQEEVSQKHKESVVYNIEGTEKFAELLESKIKLESELEAKNRALEEMASKLSSVELSLKEIEEENEKLGAAVRDLGYTLYIERSLKDHPKIKEISESIDFKKVDSLKALKGLLAIHVQDAKNYKQQQAIESELKEKEYLDKIEFLEGALAGANAKLEEHKSNVEEKLSILESKLEDYEAKIEELEAKNFLLKKTFIHPDRKTILESFDSLNTKNKSAAKALIESFTPKSFDGKSKFDAIRERLAQRNHMKENLVEESLRSQKTQNEDSFDRYMEEMRRLAGITK